MRCLSFRVVLGLWAVVLMACHPTANETPLERLSFEIVEDNRTEPRLTVVRNELQSFNWLDEADRMITLHREQLDLTVTAYGDQDDWVAIAENNLGVAHIIAGDPQLAIPLFQSAFERVETIDSDKSRDHRYRLYSNFGEAYLRTDDLASAETYFEMAIANPSPFERSVVPHTQSGQRMMMVMPRWQDEYEQEPSAVLVAAGVVPSLDARETAIGIFYELLGIFRTAEAPIIMETADRYYDAMNAAHHPRARFVISANGNMEVVYNSLVFNPDRGNFSERAEVGSARLGYENYTDAMNVSTNIQNNIDFLVRDEKFEEASRLLLNLKEDLEPLFASDAYFRSSYHSTLGGFHKVRGENSMAEAHFEKAYEAVKGRGSIRDINELEQLNFYAGALALSGQHAEAERLYEAGIAQAEAGGASNNVQINRLRSSYARSLLGRGAYARAKLVLQRNLELIREMGGRQPNLPDTYAALSQTLMILGETAEAVHMAERAVEVGKNYHPEDGAFYDGYLRVQAAALDAVGRHDEALAILTERHAMRQEGPLTSQPRIDGLVALSQHYRTAGQFEEGANIDREIIRSFETVENENGGSVLATAKLRVLELDARKDPEMARQNLVEASTLLMSYPSSNVDGVFSFGQGMTTERRIALMKVGSIAVSAGDNDIVFNSMQSLFADGIGYATQLSRERELTNDPNIASLLRRRDALNIERSRLRLDQFGEMAVSAEDRAARVENRERLDAEIDDVVAQLAAISFGTERQINLISLQQQLAPNQAVLLIHSDIPAVLAVTREAIVSSRIDMPRADLTAAVIELRKSTIADGNGLYPAFAKDAARQLYEVIFTPEVFTALVNKDTIFTQQGGRVSTLPLSLLLSGEQEYVADLFAVRTVASLSGINRANNDLSGKFIGVGAPAMTRQSDGERFGANAYILRGAADADTLTDLPPLPGAERELIAMSRASGFNDVTLLTGAMATEAAVRDIDFSNTAVLAFATHGLVAGELDARSEPALVLTPNEDGAGGLLTMSEVMELDLDVGLVILSACNTAAGGEADAAGLTGLASAFLYSGADVLMASHWPVRDDAAEALAIATVQNMRGGATPERALQLAMNEFRQSSAPQAAHPGVWAPFIIVGE